MNHSSIMDQLMSVPMPPRIAELPIDSRGFPIAYFAQGDGTKAGDKVDFRIVNSSHWVNCLRRDVCYICGTKLHRWRYFIGGPVSMINRVFADLATHEECSAYAMQVCPFMAIPKAKYSLIKRDEAGQIIMNQPGLVASPGAGALFMNRPEWLGRFCTDGCSLIRGYSLVKAHPYRSVEWRDATKSQPTVCDGPTRADVISWIRLNMGDEALTDPEFSTQLDAAFPE